MATSTRIIYAFSRQSLAILDIVCQCRLVLGIWVNALPLTREVVVSFVVLSGPFR
jgi:hypothetical protein